MDQASREFLSALLLTPSPSGKEQPIQRLIQRHLKDDIELIEPDVHGNLLLGTNTKAKRRVLLDGHCDQIGFTVKHISPGGFIYVDPLGGVDESVLQGAKVVIHAADGPVAGVVGKKAVHLQSSSETAHVPLPKDMWIDIGAASGDDAESRVKIGDYITFDLRIIELGNNRIAAPGLDNKAGLWVILQALRECARLDDLAVAVYAVSSVQEELGSRGATTASNQLHPQVGITVDVTNATDDPGVTDKTMIPCVLGKGPCISSGPNTNPVVGKLLRQAALRRNIRHQFAPSAELAGNDSKAIQTASTGVATADLGIPQRNMHTQVEVCALDDLDVTVELLMEFIRSIELETDLRPFYASEDQ